MWILLTTKLPVGDGPPKFGIFWSIPWPDDVNAPAQKAAIALAKEEKGLTNYERREKLQRKTRGMAVSLNATENDPYFYDDRHGDYRGPSTLLKEDNWIKARQIMYKGEPFRVFPREFNEMTPKKMNDYLEHSHELVSDDAATDFLVNGTLDTDAKFVLDAALVDGATKAQAMRTALGMDVTIEDAEIPAIGWYRCRPEYALFYCTPFEINMTEEEAAPYRNVEVLNGES